MRLQIAQVGPVVAALAGCTPEPASTVEMRQTVVEIVDQGRAMAIEDAMVGLVGDIDPEMSLVDIADAMAIAAGELGCTTITRPGTVAVSIEFGAIDAPCAYAGIELTGTIRVVYTRPNGDDLLASLYYEPLIGDETRIEGFSQLTWGEDGSQRLVSEIRIDAVTQRQVEIQSDRLLFRTQGELKVEGWRRWQTLMGRWETELAGLMVESQSFLPHAGLASVETPFNHTIVLDFTREEDTARVRANGGRRDRIFEITPEGEVIDAGDD